MTAVAVVMLTVAGCSSTGDAQSSTPGASDVSPPPFGTIDTAASAEGADIVLTADLEAKVQDLAAGKLIGIVCATMANDYHAILCNGAKDRAEALGFKAEIFDAQEDANRELQGFEGFLSKGAVAILEDSLGGDAITAQIDDAVAKGVTVVQLANRSFAESGAVTVAVSDQAIATAEGTAAGEYAAANFPGETVTAVTLDYPDIPSLVERANMIEEAYTTANPKVSFLPRVLGGTAENGYASVETLIQQHPELLSVVGINDAGNLGAYQALLDAGVDQSRVFLFGIDCDPQAVKLIDQGSMYKGCVETNPSGTGAIGVDAFSRLLLGETVAATIDVPVSVYG